MLRTRFSALLFLFMTSLIPLYPQIDGRTTSENTSTAQWIWRDRTEVAPKNAFTYFRKEVFLQRIPKDATLHFAADSNAHLWVNGKILQRKMTRYFETSIRTMVLDPTPFLHPGWNTIVVLHHSWGPIITFQRSASAHAGLYLRSSWVNSDASWKMLPAPEFETGRDQILGTTGDPRIRYPEVMDGALADRHMESHAFNDSNWQNVVVVKDGPWPTSLQDVETDPQEETSKLPVRIIAAGALHLHGPLTQRAIDIAGTFSKATYTPDRMALLAAERLIAGGEVTVTGKRGESKYIMVDFDEPVHGFPELTLNASHAGTIIDLGYGELPFSQYAGKAFVRSDGWMDPECVVGHGYADRYRTRAGEQHIEMPEERTARWLSVLVHFQTDGELTFSRIGFVRSTYPVHSIGSFASGDAEIDRIMELAMRHARVTMSDVYVDTPGREDGMWIEDARPRAELAARWFGDHHQRLLLLRLVAESQKSNGNFHPFPPAAYPIGSESSYDWTVEWAGTLYDEYQWSGKAALVNHYWPQLTRLWRLLISKVDADGIWRADGVLADIRVGEHVRNGTESSSIVSAQLIARLRESISLARATGHREDEKKWAEALKRMEAAFYKFHIVPAKDGVPAHVPDVVAGSASKPERRGYSQAAQAMAMLAGLIPIDKLQPDIDYAFMEPDGSPHDGVTRWNNPTYSYRALRALSDAGLSTLAVRHLRERYAPYLAGNPHNRVEPALQGSLGGPLPEYFVSRDDLHLQPGQLDTAQPLDETGSHGWGAVPLLWAHDTLLGVRIAQPGGGRLDIAPQSGGLPYVSGTTITPRGPVKVDWHPASQTLSIEKPKGIIARITLPGVLSTTNTGQPPSGCKVISATTLLCDGSHSTYRIVKKGHTAPSTAQ